MKVVKSLLIATTLLAVSTTVLADGKSVFNRGCAACHASGVAGAPKIGDKKAWVARAAQDIKVIYGNAIDGFQGKTGVMPPKGGFMNLSDDDVKAAVDYMLKESK